MSVWLAIPSKRPPEERDPLAKWHERGYKIALWVDTRPRVGEIPYAPYVIVGSYPGYATAVNELCRNILGIYPDVEWIVTGGDDVEPDLNHSAEQIAVECSDYFRRGGQHEAAATFGVMQPTGDRWGDDVFGRARWPEAPAYIDRVCGSPWMGREFCRRMYNGNGPLYPGYRHMFVDEELQRVAQKLGVLWQRRDLIHYHRHWQREEGGTMPEFLKGVSSRKHWRDSQDCSSSGETKAFLDMSLSHDFRYLRRCGARSVGRMYAYLADHEDQRMTFHEGVIKDLQASKQALGEQIEALRAEILKDEREFSEARAEAKRETELFKRAVSEIVEFKKLTLWGHVQYWWRNR